MKRVEIKTSVSTRLKSFYWSVRFLARPVMKRLLDIVGAMLVVTFSSPLLAVVAVVIKLDSKGPIFFKQQRVGLNGVMFDMWKFRSMVMDADRLKQSLEMKNEMHKGVLFKIKQDPRITRVGFLIRKLSIDELPQLINVIRGDMSLVGPRPPLANEVAQYKHTDRQRLTVVPGLTCFWQVSGRSDVPFDQQVALDVKYIESQSIWLDISLILKTIPAVLTARGAY